MWKVAVATVSVIGLILWNHARSRAKRKGIPFTITRNDIRDVSQAAVDGGVRAVGPRRSQEHATPERGCFKTKTMQFVRRGGKIAWILQIRARLRAQHDRQRCPSGSNTGAQHPALDPQPLAHALSAQPTAMATPRMLRRVSPIAGKEPCRTAMAAYRNDRIAWSEWDRALLVWQARSSWAPPSLRDHCDRSSATGATCLRARLQAPRSYQHIYNDNPEGLYYMYCYHAGAQTIGGS